MATPNPHTAAEDLTKCGICKETVNKPKALQCLHTFCLVCLKEWSSSDPSSERSVICPACKKTTTLRDDGVDGLPGNFFVSSLLERSQVMGPRPNVACVCCEEVGNKLQARCLSCEGFLCEKGIESHETWKFLKNHEVVNLKDLHSGKVNLSSVLAKQPNCDKHKGQPLWFFCETCGVLVCRDCTVVNHKSPEHVFVELESVVKNQKREIQQLVETSIAISISVDAILKNTKSVSDDLVANAKNASSDIDNAGQTAIDQIRKLVTVQKDKLDKWVDDSQSKLHDTKEKLLSQQNQLKRAQEMANQVLETGSDYDVASVYLQLKTSLKESGSTELSLPEPGQDQVVFKPNLTFSSIQSLGTLTLGVGKVSSKKRVVDDVASVYLQLKTSLKESGSTELSLPEPGQDQVVFEPNLTFSSIQSLGTLGVGKVSFKKWVVEKEFGQNGRVKMKTPIGVVITPSGDVAVANWNSSTPVQIYSTDGVFKRSLDKRSSGAWNVVALDDCRLFVTTTDNKCVSTYNSEGQYLSEFPAVSPDGVNSSDEKTQLRGLAFNRQNQLLVGATNRNYISIHDYEGNHISSIKTPTIPALIATTSQNNIIVVSSGSSGSAYM